MDPNSPSSFLYNLSLLHDKLHHLQSLSSIFHSPESTAAVIPTITTLIQEIIVTSTYMMNQMSQNTTTSAAWYNNNNNNSKTESNGGGGAAENYDIVEVEAADLLAKYTHYCHVCGKGFKRDANLRMHMRAHGEEYKSSAALSNPVKGAAPPPERKYSCPQEGCRWNRKHERFQPLKSMVCVKNHYRRSHCPKMYVCKRCNRKQFSVVSDLRTHEKHCGDLKWLCSCGTTFSRKDKLMRHVGLFVGHVPVVGDVIGGGG